MIKISLDHAANSMYIVLLNGHVACLKTTLSYLLAPALGVAHISTSVLGHFDSRRDAPDFFTVRDRRYAIAAKIAASYLESGVSVLLDGTYARRHWRDEIYRLADRYSCGDVVALTCRCSRIGAIRARLDYRRRGDGLPDGRANELSAYEESVRDFESLDHDRLLNGCPPSRVEFDSGTLEVAIPGSGSQLATLLGKTIAEFVRAGRLSEPLFVPSAGSESSRAGRHRVWIVIEGIGGSGKSEQCRRVAERLRSLYPDLAVLVHEEFGSHYLGPFLRDHCGRENDFRVRMSAADRSFLEPLVTMADSIEQMAEATTIAAADVDVCDGLHLSHLAHALAQIPPGLTASLQPYVRYAMNVIIGRFPAMLGQKVTCVLDVPIEVAVRRIEDRTGLALDAEQIGFLTRLRAAYAVAAELDVAIRVIDGTQSPDAVMETILGFVMPHLG